MKIEQANKIILNPFITEKTFELVEAQKKICFIVEKTAKKPEIKEVGKFGEDGWSISIGDIKDGNTKD